MGVLQAKKKAIASLEYERKKITGKYLGLKKKIFNRGAYSFIFKRQKGNMRKLTCGRDIFIFDFKIDFWIRERLLIYDFVQFKNVN